MLRTSWVILAVLAVSGVARAESDEARKAREEVERQLHQMVGVQPAKVRVDFAAIDEPNYKLQEVFFELDGKVLSSPRVEQLEDGTHLVWNGDVPPGKHHVRARVVYLNSSSPILSDEGGNTFKVAGDVGFDVTAGIEVQVTVAPVRDGSQRELSKRVRLTLPAKPVMLAAVDDGAMPEPVKPPKPAVAAAVDAGAPEAPVQMAVAPKPARQVETAAPEALVARPPRSPKVTPAPAPAPSEPVAAAEPPAPEPAPAPAPEPVVAAAAPVDAGAPVALAPAAPAEEPSSLAWPAIGLGFGAAAIGLVVLLARRRRS